MIQSEADEAMDRARRVAAAAARRAVEEANAVQAITTYQQEKERRKPVLDARDADVKRRVVATIERLEADMDRQRRGGRPKGRKNHENGQFT